MECYKFGGGGGIRLNLRITAPASIAWPSSSTSIPMSTLMQPLVTDWGNRSTSRRVSNAQPIADAVEGVCRRVRRGEAGHLAGRHPRTSERSMRLLCRSRLPNFFIMATIFEQRVRNAVLS
jgi:hypothetical protein